MMERGEVFVVDVRNQQAFDMSHIRGARLIPEAEITSHLDELPKGKLIVTYCS
jgi:rhodanese-related sulfurtransferase